MPSIFKKKPEPVQAPAPVDINEMIQKINRALIDAKNNETKAYENAKNAMRTNNQVMAKTYMNQVKMAQQTQKNLTGQMSMLQMKQNQMMTIDMAKQQVSLMKQINQEMVGSENVMDELQDTLQESAEQQRQTMQMNEMMNQYADMAMGMMDQEGELDQEMAMLAAEVNQEKLSGIAAPTKVEQVAAPAKQLAANNMDELL